MGLDSYIFLASKDNINPEFDEHNTIELWYGRKVYAIHDWLNNNIQGGISNNQTVIIPKEKLLELRTIVNKVEELYQSSFIILKNIEPQLQKILPIDQSDIDAGYGYDFSIDDILILKRDVLSRLNDLIFEKFNYCYYSSW